MRDKKYIEIKVKKGFESDAIWDSNVREVNTSEVKEENLMKVEGSMNCESDGVVGCSSFTITCELNDYDKARKIIEQHVREAILASAENEADGMGDSLKKLNKSEVVSILPRNKCEFDKIETSEWESIRSKLLIQNAENDRHGWDELELIRMLGFFIEDKKKNEKGNTNENVG